MIAAAADSTGAAADDSTVAAAENSTAQLSWRLPAEPPPSRPPRRRSPHSWPWFDRSLPWPA
jgi:hypothetical protein